MLTETDALTLDPTPDPNPAQSILTYNPTPNILPVDHISHLTLALLIADEAQRNGFTDNHATRYWAETEFSCEEDDLTLSQQLWVSRTNEQEFDLEFYQMTRRVHPFEGECWTYVLALIMNREMRKVAVLLQGQVDPANTVRTLEKLARPYQGMTPKDLLELSLRDYGRFADDSSFYADIVSCTDDFDRMDTITNIHKDRCKKLLTYIKKNHE